MPKFRWLGSAVGVLAMLAVSLPAFGQATTTGSIYGTVVDESGGVLPGVTATLSGPVAPQTTYTDTRGSFHFLGLSPDTSYVVTCALQGFATVKQENVGVTLGQNTNIRITMKLSTVAATVTVSGETPLLDTRQDVKGHVFTQAELNKLPTARDPWVILQQTPSVLVDRMNVGGSQSGQQDAYVSKGSPGDQNSWSVDGVTITDMAATGSSPTYFDFDAFQEMQVETGGSDPSVAVPGVALNMVTKRGTNEVHGSGRIFITDNRYQAHNIPSEAKAQGITQTNAISGIQDYGVEAGGPIVPDKAWAWGSFGQNQIDLLQVGGTTDKTTLKNTAVKLNGQPISSNSITLFYFRGDKVKLGRNAGVTRPQETSWDQGGPTSIYKVEDSQVVGSNLVLDASYSYVNGGFHLIPEALVNGHNVDFYQDGNGVWHNSYFNYNTFRPQHQVNASGSYFFNTGSLGHELKAGFSYRNAPVKSFSAATGDGNYGLEFTVPPTPMGTGEAVLRRDNVISESGKYTSFYAQDTLTASNLTVNLGVRYDHQQTQNLAQTVPADGNPAFAALLPAIDYPGGPTRTWNNWSPRVGVTYALGPEKKTLLRASYARFADQMGDTYASFDSPLGYTYLYYGWNDLNGNHVVDPGELGDFYGSLNVDPNNPASISSPNLFGSNVKAPTTDEFTVGVDHQVMPELVAGLTYTYRYRKNILWTPYIGVTSADYTEVSAGVPGYDSQGNVIGMTGPLYGVVGYNGNFGRIEENRPDFHTTYSGVELQLTKRLSHKWMAHASFSYNDWKQSVGSGGCQNPTNTLTGSGASCASDIAFANSGTGSGAFGNVYINSKWQFNISGLYQLPWNFNIAANLYGRQGYPIPYYVRFNPHDGLTGNENVLIGAADAHRNSTVTQLDLRLDKNVPLFNGGASLDLSIDMFNALNNNTILQRQSSTTSTTDIPTASCPNANCSVLGHITEIQSPRILRFGARFSF
jgi:Carboxypeptidase regulatory-like domain/TonB dependent receptor-like, beta-barrel/TonB-dependent Receptor Plug Domain